MNEEQFNHITQMLEMITITLLRIYDVQMAQLPPTARKAVDDEHSAGRVLGSAPYLNNPFEDDEEATP